MKTTFNWQKILYFAGIAGLIIGAIDPLEGSIVIGAGSVLLALSTWLMQEKQSKLFAVCSAMMIIGIVCMFYFSSLGGFGGKSTLSWWWAILLIPYPVGWLITITTLIIRFIRNNKRQI